MRRPGVCVSSMLPVVLGVGACWMVTPFVLLAVFRAVARAVERRVLARPSPPAPRRGSASLTTVGLAAIALFAYVGSVASLVVSDELRFVVALAGAFGILAGFVVHEVPGHRRGIKYALVLIGQMLLATFPTSGPGPARPDDPLVLGLMGVGIATTLIGAAYVLLVIRPDAPPEGASGRAAHVWYRRLTVLQGPDPLSIVGFAVLSVLGLGPSYLLLRYATKEKLAQRPFLYLRSFRNDASPRVFADLVGPGLAPRGVFVGLVHAKQSKSALQAGVPLLWAASFRALGNDVWQGWVLDVMDRAKGVVLDVSGDTPGLRWEIEQTQQRVDPARVLVLRDAPGAPLAAGSTELLYDLDADADAIRAEVAAFGARVNALDGVDDPAPRAFRRPRWSIGGLGVAVSMSALLGFFTVVALLAVGRLSLGDARIDQARYAAERLRMSLELAYLNSPDRDCDGLLESVERTEGPYRTEDGWGTPMRVDCPEGFESAVIRSAGPDRSWGTSDDLAFPPR